MKLYGSLLFLSLTAALTLLAPPKEKAKKAGELVVARTKPVTKFEELPPELIDIILKFCGPRKALTQVCFVLRGMVLKLYKNLPGSFIPSSEISQMPLALPPPQIPVKPAGFNFHITRLVQGEEKFGLRIKFGNEQNNGGTINWAKLLCSSPDKQKAAILRDCGVDESHEFVWKYELSILELNPDTQLIEKKDFEINVPKARSDFFGQSGQENPPLSKLESFAWSPDSSKFAIIIRGNRCKELCILSSQREGSSDSFNQIRNQYSNAIGASRITFTPDGTQIVVGHPTENGSTLIQYFDTNFSNLPPMRRLIPEIFGSGFKLSYNDDGILLISDFSKKQCAILPMEVFEDKVKDSILSRFSVSKRTVVGAGAILAFIGFSAFVVKKALEKKKQKRKKRQRKNENSKPKTQTLSN